MIRIHDSGHGLGLGGVGGGVGLDGSGMVGLKMD